MLGGRRETEGLAMSKELIQILMKRDGISKEEAKEMIAECREALMEGDSYAIEDILGLEDDYIFDIL